MSRGDQETQENNDGRENERLNKSRSGSVLEKELFLEKDLHAYWRTHSVKTVKVHLCLFNVLYGLIHTSVRPKLKAMVHA